jgi:hypothetical protein
MLIIGSRKDIKMKDEGVQRDTKTHCHDRKGKIGINKGSEKQGRYFRENTN